jgi:hypothetical protein
MAPALQTPSNTGGTVNEKDGIFSALCRECG